MIRFIVSGKVVCGGPSSISPDHGQLNPDHFHHISDALGLTIFSVIHKILKDFKSSMFNTIVDHVVECGGKIVEVERKGGRGRNIGRTKRYLFKILVIMALRGKVISFV